MQLGCLNCRIFLGQDIPEQLIPLLGFLQDKILVSKPPTLLSSPTIPYALQEIQERFCRAEESAKWEVRFWPFCLEEAGESREWEPGSSCRGAGQGIGQVRRCDANAKAYTVNLPARTCTCFKSMLSCLLFHSILKGAAG